MPYNKHFAAVAIAFNNNNNCLERKLLKATVLLKFSSSTYCFYCFRIVHRTLERAIQHTQHNTIQCGIRKCENKKRKGNLDVHK